MNCNCCGFPFHFPCKKKPRSRSIGLRGIKYIYESSVLREKRYTTEQRLARQAGLYAASCCPSFGSGAIFFAKYTATKMAVMPPTSFPTIIGKIISLATPAVKPR